ncbi:MAG TPA: endonuclease/exonuclease/phosphatase family protein [Acidobacteriota bacterium]|nr:endonuclease/exonuclease/phosphatase family protein [Acidobacteriota bacterium]
MTSRLLRAFACSLLLGCTAVAADENNAPPPLTLRVMTFNLRFASEQPPHAWPVRRPVMQHIIERAAPDVIGTQEGLYGQLRDLASDLPAYDWIGLGREGGSRGEFTAVFFRRDKFEPLAFDHFWLSDTPETIGSMTWGNRYRRMVTWVRLRERTTGRVFEVWNTHLDHEIEAAREKAAALIGARLARVVPEIPLLLVGDFNCLAGASVPYSLLTRKIGLTDTWLAATQRINDGLNTFHGYEPPPRDGERIDWILARAPRAVSDAAILDYAENGQTPSDHFPVIATVIFD